MVWYIEKYGVDETIVWSLSITFTGEHPWHLRDALKEVLMEIQRLRIRLKVLLLKENKVLDCRCFVDLKYPIVGELVIKFSSSKFRQLTRIQVRLLLLLQQ